MIESNSNNTGILVNGFIRERHLENVLDAISEHSQLPVYIHIDGPRNQEDHKKQERIRFLIENKRKFLSKIKIEKENVGCTFVIPLAIEWFFKNTNHDICIVLEDDCVPKQNFFKFISENAWWFEVSNSGIISGNVPVEIKCTDDFFLTRYAFIHGWAISRANWNTMVHDLYREHKYSKTLSRAELAFWKLTRLKIEMGILDTWDAHFSTYLINNNKINLVASKNLIENIGYDEEAAHTKVKEKVKPLVNIRYKKKNYYPLDKHIKKYFYKILGVKYPIYIFKINLLKRLNERRDLQKKFQLYIRAFSDES